MCISELVGPASRKPAEAAGRPYVRGAHASAACPTGGSRIPTTVPTSAYATRRFGERPRRCDSVDCDGTTVARERGPPSSHRRDDNVITRLGTNLAPRMVTAFAAAGEASSGQPSPGSSPRPGCRRFAARVAGKRRDHLKGVAAFRRGPLCCPATPPSQIGPLVAVKLNGCSPFVKPGVTPAGRVFGSRGLPSRTLVAQFFRGPRLASVPSSINNSSEMSAGAAVGCRTRPRIPEWKRHTFVATPAVEPSNTYLRHHVDTR